MTWEIHLNLIVSKSNLKLQAFGLFSRFVRILIMTISSSEEPANSTSIHRVRYNGKIVIPCHPFENLRKRSENLKMMLITPNKLH